MGFLEKLSTAAVNGKTIDTISMSLKNLKTDSELVLHQQTSTTENRAHRHHETKQQMNAQKAALFPPHCLNPNRQNQETGRDRNWSRFLQLCQLVGRSKSVDKMMMEALNLLFPQRWDGICLPFSLYPTLWRFITVHTEVVLDLKRSCSGPFWTLSDVGAGRVDTQFTVHRHVQKQSGMLPAI